MVKWLHEKYESFWSTVYKYKLTSGAIQYGVPTIVWRFSSPDMLAQKPKSVTLTDPSLPRRILSDLISLWIIPWKKKNHHNYLKTQIIYSCKLALTYNNVQQNLLILQQLTLTVYLWSLTCHWVPEFHSDNSAILGSVVSKWLSLLKGSCWESVWLSFM